MWGLMRLSAALCALWAFSAPAMAAEMRFCNTGRATLHMLEFYESGMLSNRGEVAGWDRIEPGDCTGWYEIDFRTTFAFIIRRADGSVVNPVYRPTGDSERGLVDWVCARVERNFNVARSRTELLDTYATRSCPAGFTPIRPSVGGRNRGTGTSTRMTLDVKGMDTSDLAVVYAPPRPAERKSSAADPPKKPAPKTGREVFSGTGPIPGLKPFNPSDTAAQKQGSEYLSVRAKCIRVRGELEQISRESDPLRGRRTMFLNKNRDAILGCKAAGFPVN